MKRIDPKKLLPSSVPAGGSVGSVSPNILVPVSNITAKTYAKVEPEENTPQKSELRAQTFQIKSKLIEVSKLFSIKNKFTRDKNRKKRIEEERERREQREKESEKTTFNFGSKLPKLVLPRTGFLDSIKRFLLYSLLGFAVEKFLPLVPKLLEFGKMLIPAAQFLTDFAGNFLVNMVNFIDRGYKVYDGIKEQLDRIIPPDISKQFSKFSGVLNAALNAALILGTASIGAGGPLGSKVGGKVVGKGVAGAATAATVAGIGISALVRKKIIARAIKNRAISSQQRQLKTDSLRSRRDALLDIRKETLKERLKENALRKSKRESRRTPEQVISAIREARKKRLREIIKSSERGASPQLLLRKAAASEELNRMYRSDANRAKLRRGIALQKGQRSRLMTVGDDVAIPFAKGQFFPKRMMPTRATRRLRKYKMPFEEAVLSKPYGYNPNIVRFSDKFPTGYVDFRYGGKTKRMSQSSARYLSSLIENASAAERVNLPFASESREIATKFFNNPENYQSQVRSFAGEDITQMNRVYGKAKRKFTKEDVIGRREVSKPTRVSPTQEVSKGVSKFKFGRFRKAGPGIFGALLDIGISLATGEPLDRAVVSAVGAGLGGWIGGIVGSALPFIGTVAVGILGSTLGSIFSLSLYDTIVGGGRNNRNVGRLTEDDKKKNREREIELEKYENGGIPYGTSQVSPPQVSFGGVYSIENLVQLALSVGFKGENAAIAAAIAMAESGGNPTIDTVKSGLDPEKKKEFSIGLWQINMRGRLGEERRKKFNIENNDLYNPNLNAQIAYKLSSGYNFDDWTTYTKGNYKTYLPAAKDALQKISSRSTGPVIYKPQSSLPQLPPTNTAHGQQYGARRRGGRQHAGVDFEISGNQTFYSRIGGKVIGIYYDPNPNGYGNYVDIYNDSLKKTERIAEGAVVLVKRGDVIQPGDAVVRGESSTGVIHYEIRKGRSGPEGDFSGTVDPIDFLNNLPKEKASISKPSTTNITQGLDEETSYEDNNVKVVVLPIKEIIEKPVPIGGKGGGGFSIDINNNIFAPALTG